MKMISVPRPISGVRRTASSMLPASLRAGMMTEQRYCVAASGRGLGRATSPIVKQKGGSNGASQRLHNQPHPGVLTGHRMRVSVLMTSQPARCSRFVTSSFESQFCRSVGDLSPSFAAAFSTGRQRLLKKLTTSLVRGSATDCSRSNTACTSGRSFTRSARSM